MWCVIVFFFKQKTAYDMRISDWSSDVCSSDLAEAQHRAGHIERLPDGLSLVADAECVTRGADHADLVDRGIDRPQRAALAPHQPDIARGAAWPDRKRAAEGKSVSVRVDFGGCRILQTKTHSNPTHHKTQ